MNVIKNIKIYGNYYNRNDIQVKIEKYHNSGMNDEEVIEKIGEDVQKAEDFEHEFYIHGDSQKH